MVAAKLANMPRGARTDLEPSANLLKVPDARPRANLHEVVSLASAGQKLNVSKRSKPMLAKHKTSRWSARLARSGCARSGGPGSCWRRWRRRRARQETNTLDLSSAPTGPKHSLNLASPAISPPSGRSSQKFPKKSSRKPSGPSAPLRPASLPPVRPSRARKRMQLTTTLYGFGAG